MNKEKRKNEFFGDDVEFEVVGSCEYVNKDERLPFGAIAAEEDNDKTADAEATSEEEVLITIWTPRLEMRGGSCDCEVSFLIYGLYL